MHSFLSRLNTIFFFALMCLAICGGIASISCFIPFVNPPDALKSLLYDVTNVDVDKFYHHHGSMRRGVRKSKFERAELTFSADIDLRDEFHWNTKQLFVWLSADYIGKDNQVTHRSSLWDTLVRSKSAAMFEMNAKMPEYKLIDPDLDLRDNNVNFTLNWDIHPWIGLITRKHSDTPHKVDMPVQYSY
mmetsp:Transcript_46496/g.77266  ORF Transcript_46496/g.77266 Transcript_46496/m.77266 type:complete len:188 (+) Transcript_46496:47-610(+)